MYKYVVFSKDFIKPMLLNSKEAVFDIAIAQKVFVYSRPANIWCYSTYDEQGRDVMYPCLAEKVPEHYRKQLVLLNQHEEPT
jgi:hypothetical protein